MGIVMANTSISIDGFVAGPNHEMDWIFDHDFLLKVPIQRGAVRPGGRSGAASSPLPSRSGESSKA
jgi:hypothetical protein